MNTSSLGVSGPRVAPATDVTSISGTHYHRHDVSDTYTGTWNRRRKISISRDRVVRVKERDHDHGLLDIEHVSASESFCATLLFPTRHPEPPHNTNPVHWLFLAGFGGSETCMMPPAGPLPALVRVLSGCSRQGSCP